MKNKFLPNYLIVLTIILLTACQKSKQNKSIPITENKTNNSEITKLSIDTFSTFPPEIDGCGCYFSNDSSELKKGEYIFMENSDGISFLKINGKLTKFTFIDVEEIDSLNSLIKYKTKGFIMTLEKRDGKQNGDETFLKTGKIILTDQNKKTITKTFYGECGC